MRALLAGCALAAIMAVVSGCGGSAKASPAQQVIQRQSDLYEIDQIEKKWHDASSHQNIDEMMSIWAPDATFQVGPLTVAGKANIRKFFLTKVQSFNPANHWVSDTPAYKIKLSVNGDKGRIYFQCHYVDVKTGKVVSTVAADNEIAKIDGKWLITHTNAASATLTQ